MMQIRHSMGGRPASSTAGSILSAIAVSGSCGIWDGDLPVADLDSNSISILKEWQEARKAIFNYKMAKDPSPEQLALWNRLANAEHALMKLTIGE